MSFALINDDLMLTCFLKIRSEKLTFCSRDCFRTFVFVKENLPSCTLNIILSLQKGVEIRALQYNTAHPII